MNLDEILDFEKEPNFELYKNLRIWDDLAKDTNPKVLKKIKNLNPTEYYQNLAFKFYNL